MKLAFKIAIRFLKSGKGQTLLIILGIAVGVSVQIFIGSLIQGLQKSLIDKTIGNSPQITVTSNTDGQTIEDYSTIIKELSELKKEITGISAAVDGPALISENNKNYSVLIRGLDLENADKIYRVNEKIYEGSKPTGDNEILIGRELKEELGMSLGDTVKVLTDSGQINELTITGFYDLKVSSINKSWMITTLKTAQNIFSLDSKVTGIEMQVKDVFKADTIAKEIDSKLGSNFKTENWKEQNAELLSGLNGQSISSIMIQVFVMIAVLLGIASVLAITVIQKSRQLGILKAMGIKDRTASLIFLFEGLLLGAAGAILGIAFGFLLGYLFTKFALNPDGTPVVELYINIGFIGISAVVAVLASTLASLVPARRSSKLNPIEVIKNG